MITALGVIIAASLATSTLVVTAYMAILSRAAERPYAGPPPLAVVGSLALAALALFAPGLVLGLVVALVVLSLALAK